jgi:hypothetical protein
MDEERLTHEEYVALTDEYSRLMTQLRDSFRQGRLDEKLAHQAEQIMVRICAHLDATKKPG